MTQLKWTLSFRPSLCYLLEAIISDRQTIDATLVEPLRPPAQLLRTWSLPHEFWPRLISAAARDSSGGSDDDHAWSTSVREAIGGMHTADRSRELNANSDRLIELLSQAGAVLRQHRPHMEAELPLRIRPLREQWLARGPGLLRQIDLCIGDNHSSATPIDVIGVIPLIGGAGQAFPSQSAVLIEAVLTNADERLPELVRLAWLVTQLRLTTASETATSFYVSRRCQLAALLLALAAADHLEWFAPTPPPLALALQTWLHASAPLAERSTATLPADWSAQLASPSDLHRLWHLADHLETELTELS